MYTFSKLLPRALASFALTSLALLAPACDPELTSESAPVEANDEDLVTPASLGLGDNWEEEAPGLWTHEDANGNLQTLGIGEAGQDHAIASLEAAEADLLAVLEARENEETRAQLEQLDALITELRSSEMPTSEAPDFRCNPAIVTTADAAPSPCGVTAKATASYSHCSKTGTVWTYAQVACGYDSKTHSCGPKSGTSVSCTSQVSIIGPVPCRSYAYAKISAPNVYVYIWDENFQRGACSSPPQYGLCEPSTCAPNQDCHCGDACRPINSICP
jgi:hypothetical protein